MAGTSLLLRLAIIGVVLYGIYRLLSSRKKRMAVPPGPPGFPIIENISDLPGKGMREWEHWNKLGDLYGPIVSLNVMGTTIIILNDADLAFELLEKRGQKHSSRPRMVFAGELVDWHHTLGISSDMSWVRDLRKMMHATVGAKAALEKLSATQEVEVRRFLVRTLKKPEEFLSHIRKEAGGLILKLTYGYNVEAYGPDPLVDQIESVVEDMSKDAAPGAWLVDMIPALRHMPEWMPGAGFHQVAKQRRKDLYDAIERPLLFAKDTEAGKRDVDSFVSVMHQKAASNPSPGELYKIRWVAGSLYSAGADTTVSTISTFFLAMVVYPEVQTKAKEELDRVIGTHRLPTLADRPKLPYISAVMKECFRFQPVAPLALPHVSTEEDICKGYRIPKGAMVMANIWRFTHDSTRYDRPFTFRPERFLSDQPEQDPADFVFGFGRRICPGRGLADSSIWLTIAQTLAVFDIGKAVVDGKQIEPKVQFQPGIISHPVPFQASIKPRSEQHEELIRRVEIEHPWESHAELIQSLKV